MKKRIPPDRRLFFGIGDRSSFLARDLIQAFGPRAGGTQRNVLFPLFFPPSILSLTPAVGSSAGGNSIVITGANFQVGATVLFGVTPATVTNVTPTAITVTSPAGAGTVSVTVTNPDGQLATLAAAFTYIAAIIPDDANTLVHLRVISGSVVDTKGATTWNEVGVVPRVALAPIAWFNGKQAEAVGPFPGDLSHFETTDNAAILNPPANDFIMTLIFMAPALPPAHHTFMLGHSSAPGTGADIRISLGSQVQYLDHVGTFGEAVGITQGWHVVSFGNDGGTNRVKLDLDPSIDLGAHVSPTAANAPAVLGKAEPWFTGYNGGTDAFYVFTGVFAELRLSNKAATNANLNALHTAIFT